MPVALFEQSAKWGPEQKFHLIIQEFKGKKKKKKKEEIQKEQQKSPALEIFQEYFF